MLVIYRIRETLRTLFLMSIARLLGYNGAEFDGGYEGVHPRLQPVDVHFVQPSAKAMDEAKR